MIWQAMCFAPRDGKPILCRFKGQFVYIYFVCYANGASTKQDGYATPEEWTEIKE